MTMMACGVQTAAPLSATRASSRRRHARGTRRMLGVSKLTAELRKSRENAAVHKQHFRAYAHFKQLASSRTNLQRKRVIRARMPV
jgi:hypothetical protein